MSLFKRLLLVFLSIVFIFGAFGCGSSDTQTDIFTPENEQEATEEGILKALGVNLGQKGTHLLQKDNDEIVLLFSNYVDLDSDGYLGKKVSVTGMYIAGKEGEKDVISVEFIKTLGDSTDTALKVYEDVDLGFRLEYPGILTPAKSQSRVAFRSSENSEQMLVVSKIALPSGMDLEKYLSDILGVSKRSTAAIGGLSGYTVTSSDDTLVDMYVEGENAVFNLSHLSENSTSKEKYREYFWAMVKSFALIGGAKAPEEETTEIVEDIEGLSDTMEVPEEEEMKGAEEETAEVVSDDTVKETPSVTPEPVAEPQPEVQVSAEEPSSENETDVDSDTDSASKDAQKTVMLYIQTNISTIAPESSENGSWTTTQFEFVEPNYVYVEYDDGTAKRKLLLTYEKSGDSFTTTIVGYFKTDEDENWETVSGSNAAYGKERTVYAGSDSEESFTLLPGYRYFESGTYDFKIQYPSAWYFAGSGGVYYFSDKSADVSNALVTLEVRNQGISGVSGPSEEVNGVTIISTEENGMSVVYAETKDSRSYRLSGDAAYADIMKTMAGTIAD